MHYVLKQRGGLLLSFMLAVVVGSPIANGQPGGADPGDARLVWKPRARIHRSVLAELSGVVASRKYPGVFWLHGDSGTDPRLIAIDEAGKILAEVKIAGAPNTDWEDICTDDTGHLYIGDIGNTGGIFPTRYVYKIAEPNPHDPPTSPVRVLERRRFKYPDGKRFNIESLFWHAGALYVLPRVVGPSTIYRVEPVGEREAKLVSVAVLNAYSVTGADVSDDGKRLMICSPRSITVYALRGDESFVDSSSSRRVTYPHDGAVEACCFAGDGALIAAENGAIYTVSAEQIDRQVHFVKP